MFEGLINEQHGSQKGHKPALGTLSLNDAHTAIPHNSGNAAGGEEFNHGGYECLEASSPDGVCVQPMIFGGKAFSFIAFHAKGFDHARTLDRLL